MLKTPAPAMTGRRKESSVKALFSSRAFLASVIVALVIGALAMGVSWRVDLSARDTYKSDSVRL